MCTVVRQKPLVVYLGIDYSHYITQALTQVAEFLIVLFH